MAPKTELKPKKLSKINDYIVWTALVTPMLEDGSIDDTGLKSLLHDQENAGNAILLLGSTGEGLNLGLNEKKSVLDTALNLNLKVPLMCGVGGSDIKEQVAWVEFLNTLRLDAYLLVVPHYAKPGIYGQYEWFKTLLDTSTKPCMIYNVPGRAATRLEPKALKKISGHKNFWAVKESSGSEEMFSYYMNQAPDSHMLSGDDPMLPYFARLGAKGVVSVASNVWPVETHEYARQCLSGNLSGRPVWENASKSLFVASNPIPVKTLLKEKRKIKTNYLRLPLSHKDMHKLDQVLEADKAVKAWHESLGSLKGGSR